MADPRVLIIANPTSGKGRGARTGEAVHGLLQSRGIYSRISYTQSAGDAERITRKACGGGETCDPDTTPGTIVACGGDGTIQQVAATLAELRAAGDKHVPVLGLAPAGRCNDFARALGITRDPEAIADVLSGGVRTPLDLGRVNGRYFCTVATLGIDAEVTAFVDTMRMPLRGTLAYLYGAIRMLFRYRAKTVRIEGDFGVIERTVFLASTANTASYGGAIPIAPNATPTDGILDLCVIDRVSRIRALLLIPVVMRGKHLGRPGITLLRSRKLRIVSQESQGPIDLWADGERIGQTPVTIEAVAGAIDVLLPKNQEAG